MSQTENKNSYNRPLSRDEMQQVMKTAIMLIVASFVFMISSFLFVHYEAIKLYPSTMNVDMVKGFAGRIEYALRYQTLLVAWLMFNVFHTIFGRYKNKALNPLYKSNEEHIQMHKNILTNSFEQIFISVVAQLIFVSFASPESILKFIPLVNIIQFVGRIGFFVGYPMKRAFGFHCTAFPNIVLVIFDVFYFFVFLFNL